MQMQRGTEFSTNITICYELLMVLRRGGSDPGEGINRTFASGD
jgi:hypothetical protein